MSKKKISKISSLPIGAVLCALFGIIALALTAVLMAYTTLVPRTIVLFTLGGYIVAVLIVGLFYLLRKQTQSDEGGINNSVFGSLTLSLISQLQMPVLICNDTGKIVWYNTSLSSKFKSRSVLYGKYIDDFCDSTMERILESENPLGLEVSLLRDGNIEQDKAEKYRVKGYRISAKGKEYFMAIFEDISEINSLLEKLDDRETIIAYAIIDNIEELIQYSQDMDNNASVEVFSLLKKKMDEVDGIVKEYNKNKFICIFQKKNLRTFTADRFSLLDDVREINITNSAIPITLSMGLANINGTLLEKERATQAALDMALQRGGDQAVVKGEEGFEFYGGKTKTVQKRTKVRARVIVNELIKLINQSDNVIVMGHRYADFDAFASALAIVQLAKHCNTKAYVVSDRTDMNLDGCFKHISKNQDYRDVFVDKSEAQDLITSGTLAVMTDVNNIAFCEAPDVVKNAKNYVVIDHHRKTAEYAVDPSITYIEPSASSASELVSELLEQVLPQGSLSKELADLLFAGIMLDTKQFSHNTGVRTFGAALYLRGEGASPLDAQALFKTNIQNFLTEARFESNVVIHRSVIAIAFNNEVSNSSITKINAAKAADRLLNVEGVLAAFAICKIGDTVHISARSEHSINVQIILEKMGGGGHFDAAGAQVRDVSIQDALAMLRGCIDEYLDENMK